MVRLRVKSLLNSKAKAATLLESLVAMVIVLLGFGIALMIYVNVVNSNNSQIRLNAHLSMSEVLSETIQDEAFTDEETKKGMLTIVKTIIPYDKSSGLIEIHLEAKDVSGKVLGVLDKIVPK